MEICIAIRGDEDQEQVSSKGVRRRFDQVPSYSLYRLVSQNAMLYEKSVEDWSAKHKAYGLPDDN